MFSSNDNPPRAEGTRLLPVLGHVDAKGVVVLDPALDPPPRPAGDAAGGTLHDPGAA
jgi:hypothetical protein